MRILHVITSLQIGGAEKLLLDMLPRLNQYGDEVDLCLFNGVETQFKKQIEEQGITVYSFANKKSVYNPLYIFKLCKLFKKYDVIHSHLFSPQLFTAIASCFTSAKLKFVTTEHDAHNRRRNVRILKYLDRWMYLRYNMIVCCGQKVEDNLKKYIGGSKYNICTINNGIDYYRFALARPSTSIVNEYKGYCISTMVASFRGQKDQPTAIKAFSLLPKHYHLLLVGDGVRRKELEALILSLGLADRVHLLGIRMDVSGILKASDVVIMSSHYEGLSLSSIEGMASGKPFVASDVDGLNEVVAGSGLLFPHQDYVALADIIRKLSEDHNFSDEVGHRCQEEALQYDISKMTERYNELYHSLVH